MAFKCRTASGAEWESKINNVTEGLISIEAEHATKGDFEGDLLGRRIKGKCLPDGMWFVVPADRPEYFYRGRYDNPSTATLIRGTRTRLGTFVKGELKDALVDDDWIGTRPPTLIAGSAGRDSSEEEMASPAETASTHETETTK